MKVTVGVGIALAGVLVLVLGLVWFDPSVFGEREDCDKAYSRLIKHLDNGMEKLLSSSMRAKSACERGRWNYEDTKEGMRLFVRMTRVCPGPGKVVCDMQCLQSVLSKTKESMEISCLLGQ